MWVSTVCRKTLRLKNITNPKQPQGKKRNLKYKHYTQKTLPRLVCACSRGAGSGERAMAACCPQVDRRFNSTTASWTLYTAYMLANSDRYSDRRYSWNIPCYLNLSCKLKCGPIGVRSRIYIIIWLRKHREKHVIYANGVCFCQFRFTPVTVYRSRRIPGFGSQVKICWRYQRGLNILPIKITDIAI